MPNPSEDARYQAALDLSEAEFEHAFHCSAIVGRNEVQNRHCQYCEGRILRPLFRYYFANEGEL